MDSLSSYRAGPPGPSRRSQSLVLLLWRAMLLRCPACGHAKVFRGWFTMNDACAACGRRFQRDAGYFLGSIYFNYAVTGTLVVMAYFSMYFGNVLADEQRLGLLIVFVIVFPAWFFRYARALWMAADEWLDPWPNEEEARKMQSGSRELSAGREPFVP